MMLKNESFRLIAPFAAWMVLMTALPSTAWAYAVRTIVTIAMLIVCWRPDLSVWKRSLAWGVPIGLAVFVIWILPEQFAFGWYSRYCIFGEGGTQAIAESCGWMIAIRLIGSAFVISVAEELFFRKFLIGFAGFWWMVALFAIEHDRYVVGAIAGMIYGWLYLRKGLGSAIVAHAVTNLVLGFWVLATDQWQFW